MNSFARLVIVILWIFITNQNGFSQSLKFGSSVHNFYSTLDESSGTLWLIQKDSLYNIGLDSLIVIKRFKHDLPIVDNDSLKRFNTPYKPIFLLGNLYVVNDKGGEVYEWKNLKFNRIDKSFTHKMQIGSTIFPFNGMIVRYGGYGFWSYRNFFTEFHHQEWFALMLDSNSKVPKGRSNAIVKIINSNVYVFNGNSFIKNELYNSTQNREVWRYNHDKKIWAKLGIANKKIINNVSSIDYNQLVLIFGGANLILVDLKKNILKEYSYPKNQITLLGNSHFYKGFFYLIGETNNNHTNRLTIQKISEEEMFANKLITQKAYYSWEQYALLIGLIIFIVAGAYFWRFVYVKKRLMENIIISGNKISYMGKSLDLEEIQIAILKKLLKTDYIPASELIETIHKDHLHNSQATRTLSSLIEQINIKLRLLTGVDMDFIVLKKSDIDKRIKTYSINRNKFITT